MEGKKIAFSFGSKQIKRPTLAPISKTFERKQVENKKELIGSIEGKSFDILNTPKEVAATELIIPLPKQNSIGEKLAQLIDTKRKLSKIETVKIPENETMDQRAAREIQEDLIKQDLEETEGGGDDKIVMPLKPDDLPLEGGTEPTLDDYGDMPVSNFGLAMLRGMGFKGELKKVAVDLEDAPMARPKGMGLGVDRAKLAQQNISSAAAKNPDEKLELKKNAFAKIISGKHTGFYGVVQGMDDYSGRVFIKLAIGNGIESVQEFMLLPVSKEEYTKSSKVINSDKYEEYKNKEIKHNDPKPHHNRESSPTSSSRHNRKSEKSDDERNRSAHSKYHNKESDSDSSDDSDDHHRRSHKKSSKTKKSKKHHSHRHERKASSYDSDEEKRFKKKTKKSKRPRSRSRSRSRPRR